MGPRAVLGENINVGFANINAKGEGIENGPAFREAFQRRRCLVPVDNFYEWKKIAREKQSYAIALGDRRVMALAGLWENWRSSAGEWVRSFAIITTTPNELCAKLHSRIPVVLGPETWPAWLAEEPADARQSKAMLAPDPAEEMTCWPVSTRVAAVKNNDTRRVEQASARPVVSSATDGRSRNRPYELDLPQLLSETPLAEAPFADQVTMFRYQASLR